MDGPNRMHSPTSLDDLFMYRLTRLLAVAGAPVVRLCEGHYGITRREWRLIAALAREGPMLSSVLAERIHLDRGRTSKAVSDLVFKGLATRTPRPNDRRLVDVALTPAARPIYEALFPAVTQINRELLAALSPDELAVMDGALTRLQARAEELITATVLPKADRRHGGRKRESGAH